MTLDEPLGGEARPALRPFSDNVIFLDTEFSSLDPYSGEIISIGLVKPDGVELYLELEYDVEVSDWVKANVLPLFTGPRVSRAEAVRRVNEFVGDTKPLAVSYVNQYDTVYLYKLFGVDGHPFFWQTIDIAAMCFAVGLDPGSPGRPEFARRLGIDTSRFKEHHALDDARLLREIYLRLTAPDAGGDVTTL